MIELWKIGQYDYKDQGLDKPIIYNQEFLRRVADETDKVDVTDEHTDKVIGSLSNITFKGGTLYCEEPSELDISGKGLSPVFDCDLVDKGTYYEPVNFSMKVVGLTDNPRNRVIYNSIAKGDDDVSDELRAMLDKKEETIAEQREEIGILKKQMEELRTKANKGEDVSKEFEKLQKDFAELENKSNEYKAIADKFKEQEEAQKEELIKEICGDDEKGREMFKKHSIEELQYMKETKIITEPNKGVGGANVNTIEDGDADDNPTEEEDKYSAEYFEKWEKENTHW